MKSLKITESITSRNSEAFKAYLKDISSIEMFKTAEDEADCAKRAQDGDTKAMTELIRRNLRFVVSVAKQYSNGNDNLADLVNEGNLGLIEAANRFDHTTGNKFISYAVWYIRKAILEFLTVNGRTIRIPANRINTLPKFNSEVDSLRHRLGREVTTNDMYEHLDYDKEEIDKFLQLDDTLTTSLDKPFQSEGESGTLLDVLVTGSRDTDADIMEYQTREILDNVLSTMNPKQEMVLRMYFGLGYDYARNLDEIGTELDVSRERVRQIKEKAVRFLKVKVKTGQFDMNMLM